MAMRLFPARGDGRLRRSACSFRLKHLTDVEIV
jgi:hypothetical protein